MIYILMSYCNVLYLLNCKLLFRLAIMVLLGCCEFNPNVTYVCENSRLLTNRQTICCQGVIGGFRQHELGMFQTASANREKTEGGISTHYMIRSIAKTASISL